MVEGLSKRISGDWTDLSGRAAALETLAAYFGFGAADLADIGRGLGATVEKGAVEYKESLLRPIFASLEEMKWRTVDFDELGRLGQGLGRTVFVAMAERLVASGSLAVPVAQESAGPAAGPVDLKLILSDVMARVRANPALKADKAVKLILTQLAIYQRERGTMEKLLPNIKDPDKTAAFRRNFRNTFEKITANIGRHYAEFKESELRRAGADAVPLAALPLKVLVPLLTRQAREYLRLRSTLDFALEGKYKVREMCVRLFNEKNAMGGLLEEEDKVYQGLAKDHATGTERLHQAVAGTIAAALARLAPEPAG